VSEQTDVLREANVRANTFLDVAGHWKRKHDALAARLAEVEAALTDDGWGFGDEAIEDLVRVYMEQPHGASLTVVDEARRAGRDARAAVRARSALAGAAAQTEKP
jgi:hypothetical protein